MTDNPQTTDEMIVYGSRCTWFGDIKDTANTAPDRTGIPLCPVCGSPLFQIEKKKWDEGIARTENTIPNYSKFMEWIKDHHSISYEDARKEFEKVTQ